jgi:hypothetical protein
VSSVDAVIEVPTAERAQALLVAALADCDRRTAALALRQGAHAIRTHAVRERVAAALRVLNLSPAAEVVR